MAAAGGSWKGGNFVPAGNAQVDDRDNAKSTGHVMFFGNEEVFRDAEGNLYRAPRNRPIEGGQRLGARWEAPPHMAQEFINRFRDFSYQPQML